MISIILSLHFIFGHKIGLKLASNNFFQIILSQFIFEIFIDSSKNDDLLFIWVINFLVLSMLKLYNHHLGGVPYSFIDIHILSIIFAIFLNTSKIRENKIFILEGFLFIILLLMSVSLYHFIYSNFIAITDLKLIKNLISFIPFYQFILLIFLLIFIMLIFFHLIALSINNHKKISIIIFLTFLISTYSLLYHFQFIREKIVQNKLFNIQIKWDTINTIGFFPSFVLYEFSKLEATRMARKYIKLNNETLLANSFDFNLAPMQKLPNIHLVLLESFLDFSMFESDHLKLIKPYPAFYKYLQKSSKVEVPVFGGYTAQSEFEALCGEKSFQEFDSIEFESMQGKATPCLPNILKKFGYHSIVSAPWEPSLFNISNAYNSLGFDEVHLQCTTCLNSYLFNLNDKGALLYDGDLFAANNLYLKKYDHIGKPLLNYIVTGYGHFPFHRNKKLRPDKYKIKASKTLTDVANQFYYRTLALANFFDSKQKEDPNSIIIIFGDHLPVLGNKNFYEENKYYENNIYKNILIFYAKGEVLTFNNPYLYEVPHIIGQYLSNKLSCNKLNQCSHIRINTNLNSYRKILSRSIINE